MSGLRRLTIGISTVRRPPVRLADGTLEPAPRYLEQTLSSLASRMSDDDRGRVRVIVINHEALSEAHEEASRLRAARIDDRAEGWLRFVDNPSPHPQLVGDASPTKPATRVDSTPHGDDSRRGWRAKLCLDYARALRICSAAGGRYVLLLEDDIVAAERFVPRALDWLEERFAADDNWLLAALYTPNFPHHDRPYIYEATTQAVLFPNDARLARLVEHIEAFYDSAPVDWLLRDYLKSSGLLAYAYVPSLFQHVGVVPSFDMRGKPPYFHLSPSFGDGAEPQRYLAARRLAWRARRGFGLLLARLGSAGRTP